MILLHIWRIQNLRDDLNKFSCKPKICNNKKSYFVVKVPVIKWICFGTEKAEKYTSIFMLGFLMKNRLKNNTKT